MALSAEYICLVEKLAELCMELVRLRMEGTLAPPELFTDILQHELKELLKELTRQRQKELQSPSTVEELREAMREYELKTFFIIHIRDGAGAGGAAVYG
ncbi:hypothetical protein AWC38_SpisGene22248 [Stylophora pistillata]|uniref:Uncharacterized protein n=1 Tax=Stylophora pistillata TaxID=50429 RepID=A0A2B4RBP6_STYPI|nr:hypothetical protein AWC38_SpisGene22248 [Stylophora pistillata]